MDYTPVVARIRDQCAGYKLVDFSATFEALKARGLPALPAAFVLPGKEAGVRNKNAGVIHNLVTFRFRVYTFAKFAGDAFGLRTSTDILEPLRAPLRDALMNWQLPSPSVNDAATSRCEFGEADFVQFIDGVLVYYDEFLFDGYYRRG